MARVELVVTDLDGTLWDDTRATHPATLAAWAEVERRGVPVLVATGRRVGSTTSDLGALGLCPPAVCLNGALGLDLATLERFHEALIPAADASMILAAFRSHDLTPCVYVDRDDVAVFVGDDPSTHPDHLASFGASVATSDLAEVCATETVLAFAVLGAAPDVLAAVAAAIGTAGITHLAPDGFYGGQTLTVSGPGMSKWDGVQAFCSRHGLDPGRVLAIGDGPNDVEMLTAAAVAVAPARSHPRALACADHVVAPTAAGGWAGIVDLLDV